MVTATAEPAKSSSFADPLLTKAVVSSVDGALNMCGIATRCVGIAAIPGRELGSITGLIGVHGKVSGFITINLSESLAIRAVGGLLQEKYDKLSKQVVDGAGEITNIIVGGIKSSVSGTNWSFSNITVPSVIVGSGYHLAFARGMEFLCATFEDIQSEAVMLDDRLLQVSISLLRL